MSNPFTRFLRAWRAKEDDQELARFIAHWDIVEAIVVAVYRRGQATADEDRAYQQARAALLADYSTQWAPRLAPHWPETVEGGRPTPSDPFPRLLEPESAAGFIDHWGAMQALASARETLNRYLLTLGDG